MKKVLLRFYSANNLGDDLFIKIITERYKNTFSLIAHKEVDLFAATSNLIVYKNRLLSSLSYRLGKMLGRSHLWLRALAKRNDLLVYIGGSIFIEKDNLETWRQEKDFYTQAKIPYYIVGSNFGPYETSEFKQIATSIFKGAADVCFRDRASYDLFKDLETTRLATDVAFTLDTSKYDVKNEKIAVFSIVDCSHRFSQEIADTYDREIVKMSRRLIEDGHRVVYMSFCEEEGDKIAAERMRLQLGDESLMDKVEIFDYNGNLEEGLSLLAKCEIVVATRFHAAILGLLFAKKVLPLAYSKKTINILKDIEFRGNVIDINTIASFDGSTFDFNSLYTNDITKQIQLAHLQFQELDKVLHKRGHDESEA